jgi:hypothetical protein
MTKKLYVVEVISSFRMRYVVEAKNGGDAVNEVVLNESDTDFKEFSQEHIGTHIFDYREISKKGYLELFDRDNKYLKNWTNEQKLDLINQIEYKEEDESKNS